MLSKMDMEGIIGSEEHGNDAGHLIKGKRTKRLRQLSPVTVATATMTSSCSSATGGGGSFSSTTFDDTEHEEEADMANCLILLAQGRTGRDEENQNLRPQNHHLHNNSQQVDGYNKTTTEKETKNGFDSYECKTCNRFFHSFQALGGHRASHKKPKMKEDKQSSPPQPRQLITATGEFEQENKQIHPKNINPLVPPVSLELRCGVNINFKPNKVHGCSICGAEFTSGQALGGHMRRHRACINNNNNNNKNNNVGVVTGFEDVHVRSRNVLELDLNLPAPEEDLRDSTFQFPALVGCHY